MKASYPRLRSLALTLLALRVLALLTVTLGHHCGLGAGRGSSGLEGAAYLAGAAVDAAPEGAECPACLLLQFIPVAPEVLRVLSRVTPGRLAIHPEAAPPVFARPWLPAPPRGPPVL